jgi:hypothetical protein
MFSNQKAVIYLGIHLSVTGKCVDQNLLNSGLPIFEIGYDRLIKPLCGRMVPG